MQIPPGSRYVAMGSSFAARLAAATLTREG